VDGGTTAVPQKTYTKKPAQWQAYNMLYLWRLFGGAEEDRTPDLRIANATLSQLSYRPIDSEKIGQKTTDGEILASKLTLLPYECQPW
jgi:hypothetical protein